MGASDLVRQAVDRLAQREDLSAAQAGEALAQIMSGEVEEPLAAAFLIALRTKGETVEELAGLAATMRQFAAKVEVGAEPLLDTAGTGGGRATYNVSTTAALIAAGTGLKVAKHGNRSATGLSGSADLLEALGARIELSPAAVGEAIRRCGFGFMFAPVHHQATRYVAPVRRVLGVRTVFNLLGPLTNPAGAQRQLIGVSAPQYLPLMAGALARLGSEHALVVTSADGLDELSPFAPTKAVEVVEGRLREQTIDPAQLGFRERRARLQGGTPAENAALARAVLAGERKGPALELALINAAAAIYVGGAAESIAAGLEAARAAVAEGAALRALERYVALSKELAG